MCAHDHKNKIAIFKKLPQIAKFPRRPQEVRRSGFKNYLMMFCVLQHFLTVSCKNELNLLHIILHRLASMWMNEWMNESTACYRGTEKNWPHHCDSRVIEGRLQKLQLRYCNAHGVMVGIQVYSVFSPLFAVTWSHTASCQLVSYPCCHVIACSPDYYVRSLACPAVGSCSVWLLTDYITLSYRRHATGKECSLEAGSTRSVVHLMCIEWIWNEETNYFGRWFLVEGWFCMNLLWSLFGVL